jgi:anti-sigma regulatory factor (Ser/Thr protein kinase)
MHPAHVQIHFQGTHAGFAQSFVRFRQALDAERLDAAPRYNAELVFEEIVANIVRYGAVAGRHPEIRVTLEPFSDSVCITFDDDGVPFDPCADFQPDPPRSLEGEKIGGFGLTLVRRAASSLEYLRTDDGHNRLRVTVAR